MDAGNTFFSRVLRTLTKTHGKVIWIFSKETILLAVGMVLFSHAYGQKKYNCLDWKTHVTVNTYLIQQMHRQYEARRRTLDQVLTSKKSTEAYVRDIRARFKELLGPFPKKAPLHPQITGTLIRDGYRIEKVVYESYPHHHVTSNLYIPDGQGKFPAALLFCGHERESKATISYQKTAILFAKHGFVVLVIDPISQSERFQLMDKEGKPLTRGGTTAHTLINECDNLVGTSAPADELWDNIRGLDYLVTRKEVDTSRIGCLGNSGGGMQTIYFAGYENRVKVFAPCSYLSSRERTLELYGPADGCAQIPGEGKAHFELDDYLLASAPKPVLILAGRYDFIDYTGTVMAYQEMKRVYTTLGHPDKIKMFTYDDGHGISKPKRETAITWFRKWLCHDPAPVHEGNLDTLSENELNCTRTGQVATSFAEESNLVDRDLELYNKEKGSREKFLDQNKSLIKKKVASLLAIVLHPKKIDVEREGDVSNSDLSFQKLILRKQGEIPLPVLQMNSNNLKPRKIIIWLNQKGKDAIVDSLGLMQTYAAQKDAVFLCDLSGAGETSDDPHFNDKKYYNSEYRNAMLALHLGMPMVGVRTEGLLTLMDYIRSIPEFRGVPVLINATGISTIAALHAALFSPQVSELNLYGGITTFKTILDHPTWKDWYSYVVNRVLNYYDLPDLCKLIGPEKIHFYNSLN